MKTERLTTAVQHTTAAPCYTHPYASRPLKSHPECEGGLTSGSHSKSSTPATCLPQTPAPPHSCPAHPATPPTILPSNVAPPICGGGGHHQKKSTKGHNYFLFPTRSGFPEIGRRCPCCNHLLRRPHDTINTLHHTQHFFFL